MKGLFLWSPNCLFAFCLLFLALKKNSENDTFSDSAMGDVCIMYHVYCMSGSFGGDFNLADLAPTTKLKSLPILLFYLES